MAGPQLYHWAFDRSVWDRARKTRTFSVGVYQWIPDATGKGLKKSKTIRVLGYVTEPQAVYAKAEELCRRLNAEQARVDAPSDWLQKQYSVPEPRGTGQADRPKRSTAKDRVTEMAREILGPEMQRLGFRRRERTFWRNGPEVCHVINLQMSRWGTASRSSFNVFLGVFWHRVEEILQHPSVDKMPPPYYRCTFTMDLGWATPARLQKSWEVNRTTDLVLLGQAVLSDLRSYGLPWLEYRSNLQEVTDLSRYRRPMGRGDWVTHEQLSARAQVVFLTMLGRKSEAIDRMREWQATGVWGAGDEELAQRLGIRL